MESTKPILSQFIEYLLRHIFTQRLKLKKKREGWTEMQTLLIKNILATAYT